MFRNFILAASIFALVFAVGCGVQNNKGSDFNPNGKNMPQNANGRAGGQADFFSGMPKGSAADLVVGKKVMVMGVANQDGTINANQIIVGVLPPDFGMGRGPSSTAKYPTSTNRATRFTAGNGGQARTGAGTGTKRVGNGRSVGEILAMDSSSLTVKENDGGSKIVFYSTSTPIYIFTAPTNTPANITNNTSTELAK